MEVTSSNIKIIIEAMELNNHGTIVRLWDDGSVTIGDYGTQNAIYADCVAADYDITRACDVIADCEYNGITDAEEQQEAVRDAALELLQALEDKAAYQERLKEEQLADQSTSTIL